MMNFLMLGSNNPVYANRGQWEAEWREPKSAQETYDSHMANSRQYSLPIWNSVGNDHPTTTTTLFSSPQPSWCGSPPPPKWVYWD